MQTIPLNRNRLLELRQGRFYLLKNKYGQHLHYKLNRIHENGAGRLFYCFLDMDSGSRLELVYSEADLSEFELIV